MTKKVQEIMPKRTRVLEPNLERSVEAAGVPRMKPSMKIAEKIPLAVVESAIVVGASDEVLVDSTEVVVVVVVSLLLSKKKDNGDVVVVVVAECRRCGGASSIEWVITGSSRIILRLANVMPWSKNMRKLHNMHTHHTKRGL